MTTVPAVKVSDLVLYTLSEDSRQPGKERPAIVVDVVDAESGAVSLIVLIDGRNDDATNPPVTSHWRPAVAYGEQGEPGTWRPVAEVAPAAPVAAEPAAPSPADELAALKAENAQLKADQAELARLRADLAQPETTVPGESASPERGSGQ